MVDLTDAAAKQFRRELEKIMLGCLRCYHRWIPRGKRPPKVCPKCKSPYWNKARRRSR